MPSDSVGLAARVMGGWLALRRMFAGHVLVADGLFAAGVGAATLMGSGSVAVGSGFVRMDALGYGLAATTAAGLVLRRRAPPAAFCVSFAAMLVFVSLRYPLGPIVQLVAVAIYSVAAWRSVRISTTVCVAAIVCYASVELGDVRPQVHVGDVGVTLAWTALPWLAGIAVGAYRHTRAQFAAAERQTVADQERLRIAHDVHDALGHGLTVISMHAAIALHVLPEQPGLARVAASLTAIRAASGQALSELRAALATLPAEPDDQRSVPGLDGVRALATAVSGDQLSVHVVVEGERAGVPPVVDAAGYRIVQESLTNVLRHAAARHADVRVCYEPAAARLSVADDGRGGTPPDGVGRGLAGMRERAHALGGRVRAGPRDGGGFEVHAVLPYPPVPGRTRR